MIISLYNTNDSNIVVDKTLTNKIDYDIKIKDTTSVINPTIILKTKDLITSNYAHIPSFNRYYYIEKIEVCPNDVYRIALKCDVLKSFKDDIKNSSAYVTQQTTTNKYYDNGYKSEVKKEVDIFKSNYVLEKGTNTILVTIGG